MKEATKEVIQAATKKAAEAVAKKVANQVAKEVAKNAGRATSKIAREAAKSISNSRFSRFLCCYLYCGLSRCFGCLSSHSTCGRSTHSRQSCTKRQGYSQQGHSYTDRRREITIPKSLRLRRLMILA
jgi:hypothetical protein